MPSRYTSSADTHAMVARIAPIILGLLGDGLPRSRKSVAALADHHPKEEVELTLTRLAVTVLAANGKYTLSPATEPEQLNPKLTETGCSLSVRAAPSAKQLWPRCASWRTVSWPSWPRLGSHGGGGNPADDGVTVPGGRQRDEF